VGWSIAAALRKEADVHIVTQIRNRDALLRAGLIEGEDFTAINSEAVARPLWKLAGVLRMGEGKGWTMVQAISNISYRYFETLVWRRFGPEIREGKWDLVHRVTPLSPTAISPIARRVKAAGVPFLLGPLNGGVPWPKGFDSERRREREWLSYVRGAYKMMPGRNTTLKSASVIFVGSRHTESEIPNSLRDRCIYLPENGIDPSRFNRVAVPPPEGPLRVAFVGRLVPYKGADMLLQAAAPLLRRSALRVEIVGDGPMLPDLRNLVEAEDIADHVHFHGWKEHREVQDVLAGCHLLGFPSIREFGGGVVLEAMALGVPPLIVDYAGPGELVINGVNGFKVPLGTREEIVTAFRERLQIFAADRGSLSSIGHAASQYVDTKFTWAAKAKQVSRVYSWVLGQETERPELL